MRGNTFLGSLAVGMFLALGAIPWLIVAGPVVGHSFAAGVYCLGALVVYLVAIAPSWRQSVATAAAASLASVLALMMGAGLAEIVIIAAAFLALARSGFLYRSRPARAVVLEAALLVGGLLCARFLAAPTVLGFGLGVWGFLLVQSLFFLAGGVDERPADEPALDPFERARQDALAVLES